MRADAPAGGGRTSRPALALRLRLPPTLLPTLPPTLPLSRPTADGGPNGPARLPWRPDASPSGLPGLPQPSARMTWQVT